MKQMPLEIRAAIYARRSSDRQNEESTAQQTAVCRDMCSRMGFQIVRIFADEAISGKTDRRPEFQKLVRFVEAGKCNVVVAYKSNRISRNMLQALTYEARFEKAGVKIIYAKEEFGDNAAGRFALRNMMNLNQFYSENMSEDIKRCLYTYAQECKVLNGWMPLGYTKSPEGKYAIDLKTAPIVAEMFELYAAGVRSSEIARIMNGRGVTTYSGGRLKVGTVEQILHNEKYIGIYKYADIRIEGGVPAIVDKQVYDAVQDRLARSRRAPASGWGQTDYILTGKLFCGHCGAPMRGETGHSRNGTPYHYYCCSTKKKNASACPKKRVSQEAIESAVIDYTVKYALTDEVIGRVADAVLELQKQNKKAAAHEQKLRHLADLDRQINNYIDAIGNGLFSQALAEKLKQAESEKEKLSTEIATESIDIPTFTKPQIIKWMTNFRTGDHTSKATRRKIIDIFINAIYLYDDHLDICYNTSTQKDTIPLSELQSATPCSLLSDLEPPNNSIANTTFFMVGEIMVLRAAMAEA